MSWDAGDGHHEGWAAFYFDDGNVSCGWGKGGPMGYDGYPAVLGDGTPGTVMYWIEGESLGAVAVCACGWRGSRRPGQDPEDGATLDDCGREWRHHVAFWSGEDL